MSHTSDIYVVVLGSVDSGKSTTIGVLNSGTLDDGNGSIRDTIAIHEHEIKRRATSDIATRFIPTKGYDITLVDLCGHDAYLKTTVHGISKYYPQYGILMMAAHRGVLPMTTEHLGLLNLFELPFIAIVSRIDLGEGNQLKNSDNLARILRKNGRSPKPINKLPDDTFVPYTESIKDIELSEKTKNRIRKFASHMAANPFFVPVLFTNNKTGYGLPELLFLLSCLSYRKDELYEGTQIPIFKTKKPYETKKAKQSGIPLILNGVNKGIPLTIGDSLLMGPVGHNWIPVKVVSMRDSKDEDVSIKSYDDHGCLGLKFEDKKNTVTKKQLSKRKGIVTISPNDPLTTFGYQFTAKIEVRSIGTTIGNGYISMISMGPILQPAMLIIDDKNKRIGTNETVTVTFRYIRRPEYMTINHKFVFMDQRTKGRGIVESILSISDDTQIDLLPTHRIKSVRKTKQKIMSQMRKNIEVPKLRKME